MRLPVPVSTRRQIRRSAPSPSPGVDVAFSDDPVVSVVVCAPLPFESALSACAKAGTASKNPAITTTKDLILGNSSTRMMNEQAGSDIGKRRSVARNCPCAAYQFVDSA
jgi:hypothetical protein